MGAFDDIPIINTPEVSEPASGSGAFDDIPMVEQAATNASTKPTRTLADAVNMNKAAQDRGAAQNWAWDKAKGIGRVMLGMQQPQETVLDKAPAAEPAAPTQPAPVDPKAFAEMKAALGAMPRQQRLQMANAPGWRGQVARSAIDQLDQEQQGADRLGAGQLSPTREGRSAHFARQGAPHDVAQAKAVGEMVSGAMSEPVRSLQAPGAGQIEQMQAREDGRGMQDRSIGIKAGMAAMEGLKAGTQGTAAAILRAAGDEETAKSLEQSAMVSKARVDGANELAAMRARAQEEGTVYGNDAYWESMATGGLASATQMVPQIGAGIAFTALTKNPAAGARMAMGLMGSQAFGDSYIEGRRAGMAPGQAASRAGIMAGFELLGERFGLVPQAMNAMRGKLGGVPVNELPGVLERFVSGLEKRGVLDPRMANVARGQLGEQFGEQITTAGQYWVDGTALGLDQPVSIAGYLEAARDTAVQTLIATGALQGAGAAISPLIKPSADKVAEQDARAGADAAHAEALAKWQQAFAQQAPAAPSAEQRSTEVFQAAPEPGPVAKDLEQSGAKAEQDSGIAQVPQGSLASAAVEIATPVDAAAHEAATSPTNDRPEPTQAMKEAGNYKVGRTRIAGMDIRIENPQGSKRRGVAQDGTPWETEMRAHYGYFAGTEAADGDKLDVFVKPGTAEDWRGPVFVIDQIDPKTGELDEHKVIMGAADEAEAEQIYRGNYDAGWQGLGAITRLPLPAFKGWAKSGRLKEPLGDIASRPQLAPDRKLASSSDSPQSSSPPKQQAPAGGVPAGKAGGSRPAPAAQVAAPEANPAPAPADPPKIAGKPVTDIQTGQLLRFAKMQSASERVRQVAAAEVKRRETEAMWAQREQERQAQEAAIVEQAREQQVTQAVATSLAGEIDAPGAMAEAFTRALQKKQKGKSKNEPVAPQAPTAPAARSEAAQAPRPDQASAATPASGSQPAGVSGTRGDAAQADGVKSARSMPASKTSKASARARAAQQVDVEQDTMLQALAKLGGVRRDIVASEFGLKPEELKHTVRAGSLKAYPFRKTGGMDLDQAMTVLAELGYFDGVSPDDIRTIFEEAIYSELGGSPRFTSRGDMRRAADAYNEQAQEPQVEPVEMDAEALDEREAIMAEAGISDEQLSAHPELAVEIEARPQSMAEGMRAMGFTEQEIADELAKAGNSAHQGREGSRAQDPEVASRQAQAPPGPGEAAARVAGGDRRDARAARRDDQDGQDAEGLTRPKEGGAPVAQEPGAQYIAREQNDLFNDPSEQPQAGRMGYETDLFGNPLQTDPGRLAPARPDGAGVRGDAQPAASVQGDTPAPAGKYRVRTFVGKEVTRKLGASIILTPHDAAKATQYLYRSAVERFDAIVTDRDGKPLAVVGNFKGAITQTSVYPATVLAEAVRVPGAAHIWFSHNHPSGSSKLSRADENLSAEMARVFAGTGIKPMGIMAVAGKRFAHEAPNGTVTTDDIQPADSGVSVPVVERELSVSDDLQLGPAISSPTIAKELARKFYDEARAPGIIMLDAQLRPAAWVPLEPRMVGQLSDTGGLHAILRAVSESNASKTMLVHGGELDATRGDGSRWTIAQNIGAALKRGDAELLDVLNTVAGSSAAERGTNLEASTLFSVADDAPIFYSDLVQQVQRSPMNAGTAGAWGQYLDALAKRGAVKADEIEWTGLREWLAMQPGKVSKAQIAEFLDANGVQVSDVTLAPEETGSAMDDWLYEWADRNEGPTAEAIQAGDAWDDIRAAARKEGQAEVLRRLDAKVMPAKFERWTVPGGRNYREVLLTLPSDTPADERKTAYYRETTKDYKSSHWDQPNVLAHVRVDDRTDADGKRVLFVHEIQSDWGQEGKKKGFVGDDIDRLNKAKMEYESLVMRRINNPRSLTEADRARLQELRPIVSGQGRPVPGVPRAPFVTKTDAWVGLAIKRVIKMAADGGYDRVAFISGEQAADLFDLSKQVSEIEYTKNPSDGTFNVAVHDRDGNGLVWSKKRATAREIEDAIGKEILDKMQSGEGRRGPSYSGEYEHSLHGNGLKVGGHGMRTFYDKIVPSVAKDVLRKVGGGQLTTMNLVTRNPGDARKPAAKPIEFASNGFDITPAIREKAALGLPLFSRGIADGVGAGVGGGSGAPGILGIGARPTFAPGPARPTISRVDLDELIVRNANNWRGIGVDRIVAVDTWAELPDQVLADARKKGLHPGLIEGVVNRNRVYLVRSALRNLEHAERVLFHEAYGHIGTRIALEGKPAEALNALWNKLNGLAGVAKLAKKHQVGDGMTAWDRLQPYIRGTQEDVISRRANIVDELISFLAQANDTSALTQFQAYLADLKAAMVALARRLGLDNLADRLDRAGAEMDVLQLVRDARRAIITGKTRSGASFMFVRADGRPVGATFSAGADLEESGVSRSAGTFEEARAAAKAFQGKPIRNEATGMSATVSRNTLDKMLSRSAVGKSTSPGLHSMAVANLDQLFERAILGWSKQDRDGDPNIVAVHRFFAPMTAGGQAQLVKMTVKETRIANDPNPLYTVEALEFNEKSPAAMWVAATLRADGVEPTSIRSAGDVSSLAERVQAFNQAENGGSAFSAQAEGFALPEFGRAAKIIEAIQNRYNRWKQAVEAVRQQGGTVTEANDFYQAEERYWGIVGAQLDDFKAEVDDLVKAVKADKLELSDVALYAYAKHAPERNAYIATINDKFPDGGSGMTNEQAAAILAKARADGTQAALEKHAATLGRWTAGTRQVLLRNGLINQAEHDAWTGSYQHYVPLRGQIGDDGSRRGTGSGFDIRGKESIRAMGRRSQAGNIVEHILQDRARALMRAGKNEVLRRFARFVLDNPDASLWEVNAVERRRSIVKTPTGEQVVESEGINKAPENTVALKDGGDTIYITVKDPVLLEQLKNLNAGGSPAVLAPLLWANRTLSRLYTSLNPVFTVLNGARDITAGAINMVGVAGFGGSGRMLVNLPNAFAEAFRAEVQGKPSLHYDEYRRTGGKTGFMDFKDIDGYAKELAQLAGEAMTWREVVATPGAWEKTKAGWRRSRGSMRKVLDKIESYNGAIENMTRYAAFKASRESGMSVAQAANVAKNITVNFNRKGSMSAGLSAWFLFFNPAVQGTARLLEAMKSKQVLATIGAGMGGVFALALANAAMGGDDEDDGMTYWDKIPEEVKERNLVIMLPPGVETGEKVPGTKYGRYIKIPMPYGYNTFAVIAQTAADVLRHQADPRAGLSMAAGAARVARAFIGAWIPVSDVAPSFENAKSAALAFVPDALDPVMEAALNTNSFGRQLYPDGMGQDKLPDSEKVWGAQKNTWKHEAARWINDATGGSSYHEGAISMTPATIDNLVRGYGGGVATFISAVADTMVTQGVARDRVEWWRAPFVKQLYGEVDTMQDQAMAYDRLAHIESAADPLKRARKAGDDQAAAAIREEFGVFAELGPVAKDARQRLTEIRKNEVRVISSDTMTSAAKNASLRQWDRERGIVYDRVNKAYGDALLRERAGAK